MPKETQTTPFSARNRAAGIVNLFWSKLGHGMESDDAVALQDIIENALVDAFEAGFDSVMGKNSPSWDEFQSIVSFLDAGGSAEGCGIEKAKQLIADIKKRVNV